MLWTVEPGDADDLSSRLSESPRQSTRREGGRHPSLEERERQFFPN